MIGRRPALLLAGIALCLPATAFGQPASAALLQAAPPRPDPARQPDWGASLRQTVQVVLDLYVRPPDGSAMAAAALAKARSLAGDEIPRFESCLAGQGADRGSADRGSQALTAALPAAFACLAPANPPPERSEAIANALLDAALAALDETSRVVSSAEFARLRQLGTAGDVSGVGISHAVQADGLKVVAAMPGGAAWAAGIVAGETILAIDRIPVARLGADAAAALRGPEGSAVVLTLRNPAGVSRDLTLTRHAIPGFTSRREGDALVVVIRELMSQTPDQFRRALSSEGRQAQVLVLDLRDNPGGLLDAAVGVANLLLAQGTIASELGRHRGDNLVYRANGEALFGRKPVVVLTSKDTGSGAEILAAALAVNGRVKVVGERTAGAGAVSVLLPLPGSRLLRLKVAELVRADGLPLPGHPVVPDCSIAAGDPALVATAIRIAREGLSACPSSAH